MCKIQASISQAVKVQATRERLSLTRVAALSCMSKNAFFDRVNNRKDWKTQQIERVARSLNLNSGWELLQLAKEEKSPQVPAVGNETRKD